MPVIGGFVVYISYVFFSSYKNYIIFITVDKLLQTVILKENPY